MFEISEQFILEHSDGILGVSQIGWESSPWKQKSLVNDEEVISFPHAKVYALSDSVLCLGKVNQNPTSNTVLGQAVGLVQRFITIQNFGQLQENRWNSSGIFPRIYYIAAHPRSPKVHEQNGRTRTIPRTNHLHVDVQ